MEGSCPTRCERKIKKITNGYGTPGIHSHLIASKDKELAMLGKA
jgi:hypothetical protein